MNERPASLLEEFETHFPWKKGDCQYCPGKLFESNQGLVVHRFITKTEKTFYSESCITNADLEDFEHLEESA